MNLQVFIDVHTFEMISVQLPTPYKLSKNLKKLSCYLDEVVFEPNKLLVDSDVVNLEIKNKLLLHKCRNLERLRCNVESSEMIDFSLLLLDTVCVP